MLAAGAPALGCPRCGPGRSTTIPPSTPPLSSCAAGSSAYHAWSRAAVPRSALATLFRNGTVADVAREVVAIAKAGLAARARIDWDGQNETLATSSASSRSPPTAGTPAEEQADCFDEAWGGKARPGVHGVRVLAGEVTRWLSRPSPARRGSRAGRGRAPAAGRPGRHRRRGMPRGRRGSALRAPRRDGRRRYRRSP